MTAFVVQPPDVARDAPRAKVIHPLVGLIARRAFGLLAVLACLYTATFMMVRLIPGDPAALVVGSQASDQDYARVRTDLGLDQPLAVQFAASVSKTLRGDLGTSFASHEPVGKLVQERIGPTAQLAGISVALVLLISLPLGMFVGHLTREGRHRTLELVWVSGTGIIGAIPPFMKATLFVFVFAIVLKVLPVAGSEGWQSLVLPVASIALASVLGLARIVRVQTLDALAQDYVLTARSKRLPWRTIYLRHVLPNVLTVALTVGGLLFSSLIAGAVFVEQIFARVGMGSALVLAVRSHDYPVVQAMVLLLGMTVVIVNALVDVLLAVIDPRSLAARS